MRKACVVCEADIPRLDTVCGREACLTVWRAWRNEASGRVALHEGRLRPVCHKCGKDRATNAIGPGLCTPCAREKAAEPRQPRTCDGCGVDFLPRTRVQVRCSGACRVAVKASADAGRVRNRQAERGGRVKRAAAKAGPRIACASCEHGRLSRTSETGYVCGLEAVMRCRPHGPAALYQSWEEEAHG